VRRSASIIAASRSFIAPRSISRGAGLLPQPSRFEGLILVQNDEPPDGLPVPPLNDVPLHLLNGPVALPVVAMSAHPRNRDVARVSYLLDLESELRGEREDALPPGTHAIVPAVAATALQLHEVGDKLYGRVAEGEERIEVALVKCIGRPVGQFGVLLRHRLLLEPGGFEGLVPSRMKAQPGDRPLAHGK